MASMASSLSSISPTSPMDESRTMTEPVFEQRQSSYVAWVNSQLKKKAGAQLIVDLKNDMRDGVVFADVIGIVSSQQIPGIQRMPTTYQEMVHNVDLVLQFMVQNRIKKHVINSTDVVEGNVKAVMRLILALAAHYKPMSVRHSGNTSSRYKSETMIDIAQGASAALRDARRQAKKAGKRCPRSRHDSRYQESSSEPCSDSDQSYLRPDWRLHPAQRERQEVEGCSTGSSPRSSCTTSPRTTLHFPLDSPSLDTIGKEGDSIDSGVPTDLDDSHVEAVKAVKKQLLQLQDLILSNMTDSAAEVSFESSTPENSVFLKSQLQHTALVNEELREEMSRLRNDCLQLQGTKAGLQQRLNEQDTLLSQLKSDKLNLEIELQAVTAENVSLHKELKDQLEAIKGEMGKELGTRDRTISSLKREVMKRDQMIDKLQQEKKTGARQTAHHHHHSRLPVGTHSQGSRPERRAGAVGGQTKGNISQVSMDASRTSEQMAAEVSFLQDSLQDMQSMLSTTDPGQPPLDRLEKSIITVLQNLRVSRFPASLDSSCSFIASESDMTKKKNIPRLRQGAFIAARPGARQGVGRQGGDGPSTSVIFFPDQSLQPHVCLMPGKLGNIKLRDFKRLFENCEKYRYYFKSLDTEYGTVKEELTKEDAIVPGWEDKIVAWVETDSGTSH